MSGQLEQDFLYVGQTWKRVVPLSIDNLPYNADGAQIAARFVSVGRSSATNNGPSVTCSDSGASDFSAGVIEVVFSDTETLQLVPGTWTLEILVDLGGQRLIFQATPSVSIVPTGFGQ